MSFIADQAGIIKLDGFCKVRLRLLKTSRGKMCATAIVVQVVTFGIPHNQAIIITNRQIVAAIADVSRCATFHEDRVIRILNKKFVVQFDRLVAIALIHTT